MDTFDGMFGFEIQILRMFLRSEIAIVQVIFQIFELVWNVLTFCVLATMSIFRGSRETQKGPWKRQKEVRLPRIAKSGEWSTKLNKGAKTKSEFDPELAISSFLGFEIA